MTRKKLLSLVYNGLFIVAILLILFVPAVKIMLIQGLMKIGLFSPNIHETKTTGPLPAIALEYPDGRKTNLQNLKGKVIFINFWATWCPPCVAEMPSINELHKKLKADSNIIFLMIDVDHDFKKSVPFMQKHQFYMPLVQANSSIPDELFGSAIPTTVIFDKAGKMVFRHEGMADYGGEKLVNYLSSLVKAK